MVHMKKIVFILAAAFFFIPAFGQNISKITITGSGQVDVFAFGLDENVQVYVTRDGRISKWGFDRFIGFMENYNNELEPYVGRVEYYTQNDDEAIIFYFVNDNRFRLLLNHIRHSVQLECLNIKILIAFLPL